MVTHWPRSFARLWANLPCGCHPNPRTTPAYHLPRFCKVVPRTNLKSQVIKKTYKRTSLHSAFGLKNYWSLGIIIPNRGGNYKPEVETCDEALRLKNDSKVQQTPWKSKVWTVLFCWDLPCQGACMMLAQGRCSHKPPEWPGNVNTGVTGTGSMKWLSSKQT